MHAEPFNPVETAVALKANFVARGFSVVALDAPGHGTSPRGRSSAPAFAAALRAVEDRAITDAVRRLEPGLEFFCGMDPQVHQEEYAPNGDRFLVLLNGRRYEGEAGSAEYRITEFERYSMRIEAFEAKRVEVVILSRNDPVSGMRVFRSVQHYGLTLERGVFTRGQPPWRYLMPLRANLFLSANEQDVMSALDASIPAARVVPESAQAAGRHQDEVRIAFDGDAVLFSDEAENVYQREGLDAWLRVARILAATGVHVPAVLAVDAEQGFVLIGDLGRQHYLEALAGGADPEPLYADAIDALVRMQSGGAAAAAGVASASTMRTLRPLPSTRSMRESRSSSWTSSATASAQRMPVP